MKRLALLFTCFLISMSLAIAQNKQVSGTVLDETGEPVIGASVTVKGNATIGTVTNLDGQFTLDVSGSAETLIVRYLGKQDQEVAVEAIVNVILQPSNTSLDEVIVVAYGTAKKSSFTGSASTIKGEKLEKIQTSNLSKSLEGSVSGLQTTSGSGQPGASASIVIRGLGSISASRNPLIVLDGVPYEGSLNSISTYDIESCTVLKDAAANSLYGARGSNGVIIITTKKGKSGKTVVNFDARAGFNTRGIPTYDVITDPGEYYEMYWESLRNKNLADGASYLEANAAASANLIGSLKYNRFKNVPDAELINPATGKLNPNATTRKWDDNWITDPFRKGLRQEYNVNVSQGTENSNIYASVSYLDDSGYVVDSDFKRITALLKGEQKIGDYFKVNGTIGYTNASTNDIVSSESQYSNIFMFGQQIAPIYPIYLYDQTGNHLLDKNGNKRYDFGTEYARPYASEQNPVATIEADIKKIVVDNLTVKGAFEAKFLKDFTFTVNAAYDVFNILNTDFATPIGGDAATVGGRGEKTMQRYSALNINQLLNYKKSLDDHNFDVLLVHETKFDNVKLLYGHMTNFVDPANPEFSNAARYQDLTSQEETYSLEGYLGKADYNFKDTYYLTASLRRDGSSRFHKDNRWGNFWAAGASWRISKEEFLSDVDFINELKLKTSYGTQGNDNIINASGANIWYVYQNLYSVSRIDGEPSASLSYRGNPALTWEKSNNFNAGIELDAWENRVLLNADFFIKETTDLLYAKPLAVSEGLPSVIYVNDIDMRNTGFEVELGVDIIKTNDLKWNINLNATHYKNKLTRLPSDKADLIAKDGGYQAGGYWRKIGGSIYDYYTYEYAGVDKNGKALYNVYEEQRDDNGVLTGFEKKEPTTVQSNATLRETGKSPIPDLYGGIGSTLEFAGVDFSIQTACQLGGYVMDDVYQTLMNAGENGENFHKDMFQRWTPENRETNIPKLLYEDRDQNAVSDRWLTDASYFSIRNVTLGYTFPKKWLKSAKIEKLRVYGVADNVWYTSKRTGLDVRQSFTGAVSYIYSPLRTISFGVQLSF